MSAKTAVIRSAGDVSDLIENSKSGGSRWIVAIALGCTFLDGYDFSALGVGSAQIKEQFNPSPTLFGTTTAAIAIGALLGALVGGYLVDKIGRKRMLGYDLLFFVVAAIGAALSPDIYWLIFFRLIMGIGVGMDFPVALSFIAEARGRKKRASTLTAWGVMFSIGTLATYVVALVVHGLGGDNTWRIVLGLGAVPAILVVVGRWIFIEESPMWLASSGDLHGAARVLKSTYNIEATVDDQAVQAEGAKTSYSLRTYLQVLSPKYLKRTILVSLISLTQSMQFYAVSFYLPLIALQLFGKNFYQATVGSMLLAIVVPIGTLIAMRFIDKKGPRILVIIGYAGVLLSLLAIGITFNVLPLAFATAFICVFQFFHGLGPGTLGMTMSAMSYPTDIRGAGVGIGQAVLRVGSILGFYIFPILLAAVGLQHTLLLLAIVPLVGLLGTVAIKWNARQAENEEALPNATPSR